MVAIPFSGDLFDPGIKPRFSALQADFLMFEPPGKPNVFIFLEFLTYTTVGWGVGGNILTRVQCLLMDHFILRLKVCSESTTFKSYLGLFPFPLFRVIMFFV